MQYTLGPLCIKLCGHDTEKQRLLHRSKLEPAFIAGKVLVIRLGSPAGTPPDEASQGRIECIATVTQPGNTAWDAAKKKFESMAGEAVSTSSQEWHQRVVAPLSAGGKTRIPNGKEASYYVHVLATSRSAQRKGLASAILEYIESLAKKGGTNVALTTQADYTARFYERCGFRAVYTAPLNYGDGLGESSFYVMVNDPSKSGPHI
ncbi:hypothetical protein IAT40_007818 [Kwoniella sp. CBS 6097]